MSKSLSEQLAPLQEAITVGDTPVRRSRPRCMCHNRYLNLCPNTSNAETSRVSGIMDQAAKLDTPMFQPRQIVEIFDLVTSEHRPARLVVPETRGQYVNRRQMGWRFQWIDVTEDPPRLTRPSWAPLHAIRVPATPLNFPLILPPVRCKKHGHKSRGAAESQLRSILNRPEYYARDWKDTSTLTIYRCREETCRFAPYHVGHGRERTD